MAQIKIHEAQAGDILLRNAGPGGAQYVYVERKTPGDPYALIRELGPVRRSDTDPEVDGADWGVYRKHRPV